MQDNNILNSPVPKINVPVLAPTKATEGRKAKRLSEMAKAKINKFADWIMSFIPPEKIRPVNKKIESLKNSIKKIYEGNKIKEKSSALKSFLTSYQIKGNSRMDPKVFFQRKKLQVINLLKEKEKPIKAKMILEAEFYKKRAYFYTYVEIISASTNSNELYNKMTEQILEKIKTFQNQGSGWIFRKIIALDIHIDKYKPGSGNSFLPLPKKLSNIKDIINPRNKDSECFKWAITTALFSQGKK